VIFVDTTVLVYAVGDDHALKEPCRRIVEAVAGGDAEATTTVEVIQEFVHVRARRRGRPDAAELGRLWADLLSPLVELNEDDLRRGLRLFERHEPLGCFDAVLAAAALERRADAFVSADAAFDAVPKLRHVDPRDPSLDTLIGPGG
jgi:uncharacterized protein